MAKGADSTSYFRTEDQIALLKDLKDVENIERIPPKTPKHSELPSILYGLHNFRLINAIG